MDESWTTLLSYRLHDLLMFSADTYFRLFERVNHRAWPAPLLGGVLAVLTPLVLVMCAAATAGAANSAGAGPAALPFVRSVLLLGMALASAMLALLYLHGGFEDIHWLGRWWTLAFACHSALAVAAWLARNAAAGSATAAAPPRWLAGGARRRLAWSLLALSALWPALAPIGQRPWWQAEVLGLAPDPTVLWTMGLVLWLHLKRAWSLALLAVPLAWCGFSGATLWAMAQPQALVLPLAGAAAVVWVVLHPSGRGRMA
jgi:hypothetical protein